MARAREEQLKLVMCVLMDERFDEGVLKIFEGDEIRSGLFDAMMKKAHIDTEAHDTRDAQLKEFRRLWSVMKDNVKESFDEAFEMVGRLFEKTFGLADSDSSSEDEKKKAKQAEALAKFDTKWFSVNETAAVLESTIGRVLVENLLPNFASGEHEQIFKNEDGEKEGVKETVKNAENAEEDEAKKDETEKKPAAKRARTE